MLMPIVLRPKQNGVVLVITLIVLVAMTLAAIALVRSVDTTNVIAGNLAFRQAALHAADAGIEDAVNVLLPTVALNSTTCAAGSGYKSFHEPNLDQPNQTWSDFWASLGTCPKKMTQDAAGNTLNAAGNIVARSSSIEYIVESMCDQNGQTGSCATPPPSAINGCAGNDLGLANQTCVAITQKYYRITSRVQGPRNTVSFIQAFVAM